MLINPCSHYRTSALHIPPLSPQNKDLLSLGHSIISQVFQGSCGALAGSKARRDIGITLGQWDVSLPRQGWDLNPSQTLLGFPKVPDPHGNEFPDYFCAARHHCS